MASETRKSDHHDDVDHERDRLVDIFDESVSRTGQQYAQSSERAMGSQHPSGHPLNGDPSVVEAPAPDAQGRDVPPEAGRRAWFDSKTGEVHGSGSGASGGNCGEDYDEATPGGA